MTTYIISYDLVKERDYDTLYLAIKESKEWARISDSTWAVVTEESAVDLRDRLIKSMDVDDRLFVLKSGIESAWRNSKCSNEWLKKWL